MPKVTIKSLQEQLATVRELHQGDARVIALAKESNAKLLYENEALRKDKEWLQRMHSSLLQATAEMFRNR